MNLNTIYCGDAVSIINQHIPTSSIDLVVTSPPYDNIRDYKGYHFSLGPLSLELYRVMTPGGVIVWITGDETINGSETLTSFKTALQFRDVGFNLHDTMIFRKSGFNYPGSGRYNQIFEYMFVFSKGAPKTFNPVCDLPKKWGGAWGKTTVRKKDGSLAPINAGNENEGRKGRANVIECPNCGFEFKRDAEKDYGFARRGNIWPYRNSPQFAHEDKFVLEHPATFPMALAEDHILSWSNEGDVVLDPLCGSGTTCIAAMQLQRKFIGIDISQEYVDLAYKRLAFYLWDREDPPR